MKKYICIIACFILAFSCLMGCSKVENTIFSTPELDFNAEKVESIDAVYGAVPVDAHNKHITKQDDIELIIDNLNSLEFKRYAKDEDIPAGGIGTSYTIHYNDGTSEVIFENHYIAGYKGELYAIEEADFSNIWEELDYEAVLVGEEGIPEF